MKTWKDNVDAHLASPESVADGRKRIEARLLTAHPSVRAEEQKFGHTKMISYRVKRATRGPDGVYDHDLATVEEIAAFLRVPRSWVYERTRRRGIERIPHFKLGKYLRFARPEVLEWVQHQRRISLASR